MKTTNRTMMTGVSAESKMKISVTFEGLWLSMESGNAGKQLASISASKLPNFTLFVDCRTNMWFLRVVLQESNY